MHFLDYQGRMGPVTGASTGAALKLMGLGMLGIFLVMVLISLLVVVLNHVTGKKKSGGGKNGVRSENKGN